MADEPTSAATQLTFDERELDALFATDHTDDLTAELVDRRVRALAHLAPIHNLERDKNMGRDGRDWDQYDTRLLTIVALDAVVTGTGLTATNGVPRADVLDTIASHAARCAPDRPVQEHRHVAETILDRLLNIRDATRGHQIPHTDILDGYQRTTLDVRLLYELPDPEHDIVVIADPTAVNLLLVRLDADLADTQIAAEAVLEAQLRTRRLGSAVKSAHTALQASHGYRNSLRQALTTIRQDLRQLDWLQQVEPQIDAALDHIEDRLRFERTLRTHAEQISFEHDSDPQMVARATKIVSLLDDAIETLTQLSSDLLTARTTFRNEQNRQAFAPPAPITLRDIRDEILEPYARMTPTQADTLSDTFHTFWLDHHHPTVLALDPLITTLTATPRPAPEPQQDRDDELVEPHSGYERFDVPTWDASDQLLNTIRDQPTRLSQLLDDVDDPDVAKLTALRCLHAYDAADSDTATDDGIVAHHDGQDMTSRWLIAPDLLIHRPASPPNPSSSP